MTPELKARFDEAIRGHKIVLFMKGNALFPQCGFSARALQILQQHGEVHTVDVLADPEVRQGIKEYTQLAHDSPGVHQREVRGRLGHPHGAGRARRAGGDGRQQGRVISLSRGDSNTAHH